MRDQIIYCYQRIRIAKFWLFSDCKHITGKPILGQPVQMVGPGRIKFHNSVRLGFFPSPHAMIGYIYIEVRAPGASVEFGDNVFVNNGCVFVSNGPGIVIGAKTMFGGLCEVLDCDFHSTHPDQRATSGKQAKVIIGENVWIGSNVKVLKGVTIGTNSVVGNGAIVSRSIPPNMLAFGNPIQMRPLPCIEQREAPTPALKG